jgi:hypothetical protein
VYRERPISNCEADEEDGKSMGVKIETDPTGALICNRPHRIVLSDGPVVLNESAVRKESEQLSRQAGRILEQLITLDEHYHEMIKHDESALEALAACTAALSKLAHVRSVPMHVSSIGRASGER